jgi:protoporphyrinogen oxidase
VHLRHRVVGVARVGPRVVGVDVADLATGAVRRVPCQSLISSLPIGELARHLEPESAELARIAASLPHRDFMTAGVLLKRMRTTGPAASAPRLLPDNWIYVQEEDVRLGRVQIFNNWSPYLVRDPTTVWLGLEYFCAAGDALWSMPDASFLDFATEELERIGLADRHEVLDGTVVRVPKAYPAYFGEYRHIGRLREWLDGFDNVFPVGRNGMHRYNNQDHSMLAARAAVDCIATGTADKAALWAVNTEEDYHEVRKAAPSPRA